MGFWGIFWLWSLLLLGSLTFFAFLGMSLFNRLSAVAHQAERVAKRLEKLANELSKRPDLRRSTDSVLADPIELQLRRRNILKARTKKLEKRQRRLIASLKRFDSRESRFRR